MPLHLLAVGQLSRVIHLLLLIAAVSFVYAATRHEEMSNIYRHAAKIAGWTVAFFVLAAGVLMWISSYTM